MPDWEKLIEGLKELRSHFNAMAGIASSKQGRANHIESARIIGDAITRLEEQEPRMLGIVEICNLAREEDNIVWCESCPGEIDLCRSGWAEVKECLDPFGRSEIQVFWPGSEVYDTPSKGSYGKTWVCFTKKPSVAQREAIPWN